MIYGLLIISVISISWGIAYDYVPYYFPLSGIVAMGLVMAYQLFRKHIPVTTRSTDQNQQAPSTTPAPSAPPTPTPPAATPQPASTSKISGWMWFIGGMAAVVLAGVLYFSVTDSKIYPKMTKFTQNGRNLYEAKVPLSDGRYKANHRINVYVYPYEDENRITTNNFEFILKKEHRKEIDPEKRKIRIASVYEDIVITSQ